MRRLGQSSIVAVRDANIAVGYMGFAELCNINVAHGVSVSRS
jgi:hypothetical protein